jgi:hypothetical protein
MTDETSPDRVQRVQRLAEALNEKKRMEDDDSHSAEQRMKADEKVNQALEAVRTHKSDGSAGT